MFIEIFKIKKEIREKLTLYMNHLLVIYAFLLPISPRANSTIFIIILFLFIVRGNYIFYLKNVISNKIVQACILFFLIYIVWLLGTENYKYAKTILADMKYIIYPIIFLSFLDRSFFLKVISFFIFGMLFSEILSYLITFNILPSSLLFSDIVIYSIQEIGNPTPFINHGKYNIFMSIVIGIILYKLLKSENSLIVKIISIFFITTATLNITLIGGRIGYVGYCFIILAAIMLVYKRKSFKFLIFGILSLVVIGYIAYYNSLMFNKRVGSVITDIQKMNNKKTGFNSSVGARLGLWYYSTKVIKDNLFFGVGTGDHVDKVRKYILEDKKHKYLDIYKNLHNGYIEILVQFGIIGLILYFNIFYQIIRYKYEDEFRKSIMFIVSLGISVGIITGVYGSALYLPLLAITISATTTKNNYLSKYISSKKIYLYYILFIIFFFIIAVIQ